MSWQAFETLETRSLLSATIPPYSPTNPPPVPEKGTIIGLGSDDLASVGIDPDYATRNHVVVLTGGGFGTTLFQSDREGNFVSPVVKADGSIDLQGSATDDYISVERVRGLPAFDPDATGVRQINFIDQATGSRKYAAGGISASSTADSLDRFEGELAELETRLANAVAGSQQHATLLEQIEQTKANVDYFRQMHELATSGDFIRVKLNGVYDLYVQQDLSQDRLPRISVDAGAGNDVVQVSQNVPLRSRVYGGSGADKLTGGKKPIDLFGGGGNDRLYSRSVRGAVLDGGKGVDRYFDRASGEADAARVIARDDGDALVIPTQLIVVRSPGLFSARTPASGDVSSEQDVRWTDFNGVSKLIALGVDHQWAEAPTFYTELPPAVGEIIID